MARYQYYRGGDGGAHLRAMQQYGRTVQELDKLLRRLIVPYLRGKRLAILDAGCGAGHLSHFLSGLSPASSVLGVDQTDVFIEAAEEKYGAIPRISFITGSVEDLSRTHPKAFDITVSRAVLSWLPYYEDFMRALVKVTKKHIFVSSLFYEGDIDFITQVREFKKEAGKDGFSEYRNVYSLPRFEKFVRALGAKKITVTHFTIGIDIPKGDRNILGTYTVRLADDTRLQISGAVLMNWKWVRIDL